MEGEMVCLYREINIDGAGGSILQSIAYHILKQNGTNKR